MKKKEKWIISIITIILLILSIGFYGYTALKNKNADKIIVKKDNEIIATFDFDEDGIYEFQGNYGIFNLQIEDGRYRAINVTCPTHQCMQMGWKSKGDPFPVITCKANGIVVYQTETSMEFD